MKKLFLGSLALAATLAGPAMAADMPLKAPPPVVTYYDWSGFYLGFSAGGMWSHINHHFTAPTSLLGVAGGAAGAPSSDFSTSGSGFAYDVHLGLQQQWGNWVLGVEGAIISCDRECRENTGVGAQGPAFPATWFNQQKVTNVYTAGVRVGWAWNEWLLYATGGWAAATLKSDSCTSVTGFCGIGVVSTTPTGPGATSNSGWYAGVGLDTVVWKGPIVDVIAGVEYQYYKVNSKQAFCNGLNPFGACGGAGDRFDYSLDGNGSSIRARLTIKTHAWDIFWAPK